MEIVRKSIAEKRASTDASLGAERANADAAAGEASARARRLADDLIERERILVDERLRKFRDRADMVLARDRLLSHAPHDVVTSERTLADAAKLDERAINDSALEAERQRSDKAVRTERNAHAATPLDQAFRIDTDAKLGAERIRVDGAVNSLGRTEGALSLAEEEIERRTEVLAMVAHELRTPLSIIAMSTEFLAEGVVEPEALESAEDVRRSIARMQRLLLDLFDLARIEGGTLRIVKQPFDVGSLVSEIVTAYGPLFTKRGVTFGCRPPAPRTIAVFDHDRIVQVISNLLTNAMKFTPDGGAVSLHVEPRTNEVEFAVCDTGCGISPQMLSRVFNRFWQGGRESETGLGLGLYICERIVTAHGGRIWVESTPRKGTVFRFTLPLPAGA